MSPFSLLKHAITERRPVEFFDARDIRRVSWHLALKAIRIQAATAMPETQASAHAPQNILRRGRVIYRINSLT
jgi:hypothetical protein